MAKGNQVQEIGRFQIIVGGDVRPLDVIIQRDSIRVAGTELGIWLDCEEAFLLATPFAMMCKVAEMVDEFVQSERGRPRRIEDLENG
jgi:hypothetical protein